MAVVEACNGDANTTSSSPDTPDEHFFRTFHDEAAPVGYVNPGQGADTLLLQAWSQVTVERDSTMNFEFRTCTTLEASLEYTWSFDHETGTLQIAPTEGDIIHGFAGDYSSISLAREPECDGLIVRFTRAEDNEVTTVRYLPGRVCADAQDGDPCKYEITWCDAGTPPTCPVP